MNGPWRVTVAALSLLAGTAFAADWSQSDRDFDIDFEPDDVLALNMSDAGRKAARSLGFRARPAEPLRNLRLWLTRLRPPPGFNARLALERLKQADPEGIYSYNDHYALAGATPACDPARCFGRALTGLDSPCRIRPRLGMVDSAVDRGAPQLAGKPIHGKRFSATRAEDDELRHGTAVASLLVGGRGADALGLLPEAELYAADVFSRDREGQVSTDVARIAAGMDWLAGAKVSVLNMSFDGPASRVLEVVTQQLLGAGIVLVAAAGNRGPDSGPTYPAAYSGVIAVTAVDRYLKRYAEASSGSFIALAAPGVAVWTADEAGAGMLADGTSFAAPFVTAAVARLRAAEPKLPSSAVRGRLIAAARDLGAQGDDAEFGGGLVQAPACRGVAVE